MILYQKINDISKVCQSPCMIDDCPTSGKEDTKFYKFPKNNPGQLKLWILLIKIQNQLPSDWKHNPDKDLICEVHFFHGKPCMDKTKRNFGPSFDVIGVNKPGFCCVPSCGYKVSNPLVRFYDFPTKNGAQRQIQ
jgi:hypothetical protein